MTLTLPWPPTTNTAYTVARGRKVKTKAARAYAEGVAWACASQLPPIPKSWTASTRFRVSIIASPPDHRRRDLANTEKLAIDAIFAWLELDDSQIDQLHIDRGDVRRGGQLFVTIEAAA